MVLKSKTFPGDIALRASFRNTLDHNLEKGLIGLVVVIAAVVLLTQLFIYNASLEQAAAPVASPQAAGPILKDYAGFLEDSVLTFQLKNFSSLPLARVLVNGEPRGEFRDRYVTVHVREGDVLEVDGTRYKRPLVIEILDVSGEVVTPTAGSIIRVEGNISFLGRVHLTERKNSRQVH
jgi:hypothetical protein